MTKSSLTIVFLSKIPEVKKLYLDSANFADKIIICVDSEEEFKKDIDPKTKIISHCINGNFAKHRNFALSKAKTSWVFFVDDDEYISSELAKEIQKLLPNTTVNGFQVPRIDVCYSERFLHGETGNQLLLRLAKRRAGKFKRPVHEIWKINGQIGKLENPIYHQKNHFVSEFIPRIIQYGPIDAAVLSKEHKSYSVLRLLFNPKLKFIFNYLFKLGFLDGTKGLFSAYLMSVQSLSVRVFQWSTK